MRFCSQIQRSSNSCAQLSESAHLSTACMLCRNAYLRRMRLFVNSLCSRNLKRSTQSPVLRFCALRDMSVETGGGESEQEEATEEVREFSATFASSPAPIRLHSVSASLKASFATFCPTWVQELLLFCSKDRAEERESLRCVPCLDVSVSSIDRCSCDV